MCNQDDQTETNEFDTPDQVTKPLTLADAERQRLRNEAASAPQVPVTDEVTQPIRIGSLGQPPALPMTDAVSDVLDGEITLIPTGNE